MNPPTKVYTQIGSLDYCPILRAPTPPTLFLTNTYKHLEISAIVIITFSWRCSETKGWRTKKLPEDTLSPSTPNYHHTHPKLLHFITHKHTSLHIFHYMVLFISHFYSFTHGLLKKKWRKECTRNWKDVNNIRLWTPIGSKDTVKNKKCQSYE